MKRNLLVLTLSVCAFCNLSAQPAASRMILHGTVCDDKGRPLAGVKVKLKGSGYSTMTQRNGRFRVFRPVITDTLLFAADGYDSEILLVNKNYPVLAQVTLRLRRPSRISPKAEVSVDQLQTE